MGSIAASRQGLSSSERERIKALEHEVKELRRASEIHEDGQRVPPLGVARLLTQ